jgi:hypothetical protein
VSSETERGTVTVIAPSTPSFGSGWENVVNPSNRYPGGGFPSHWSISNDPDWWRGIPDYTDSQYIDDGEPSWNEGDYEEELMQEYWDSGFANAEAYREQLARRFPAAGPAEDLAPRRGETDDAQLENYNADDDHDHHERD